MNEATDEEKEAIGTWLGESEENGTEFQEACRRHLDLSYTLAEYAGTRLIHNHNSRKKTVRLIYYAAGIAAAIGIGFFCAFQFFAEPVNRLVSDTVLFSSSLPGQRTNVVLSDGTEVCLNSGSRIEYPAIFHNGERRVRLHGEAMFDVTHDPEHPFIVETFEYDIRVLGTRFDVIADEEAGEFSASLIEGKVEILDKDDNSCATMLPNQVIRSENGRLVLETTEDAAMDNMWTDGIISVSGVPFDRLMDKFERCYGVRIIIDDGEIPEIRYNYLKIRISDGIVHALEILKRRTDFEYRYDDMENTYHISTE